MPRARSHRRARLQRSRPPSLGNKIARLLWSCVWLFLYRPSPPVLHFWRRFLLRLFGARIQKGAHPYPTAKVWAPWNLTMENHSCLGPYVDCYCVDKVTLGPYATVSQYSYLCTAGHDYQRSDTPLITGSITIQERAWVFADSFIGPGVTLGQGSIIGARSNVVKNVKPWTVVAGNPATFIRRRSKFRRKSTRPPEIP